MSNVNLVAHRRCSNRMEVGREVDVECQQDIPFLDVYGCSKANSPQSIILNYTAIRE